MGGTPPVRYLPCVVPCKLYFVKYHKQLELWKKEIESLLPQKGQSAAIDKRILELDSKLEKSIDGHAAISDEVKNDLKSNKLDELIDKIDLLLKED